MKYNSWETEYELTFVKTNYANNGNLAIQIMCKEDGEEYVEPFCMLTVNLGIKLPENVAFVDTNNCPATIVQNLLNEGLIVQTHMVQQSGFCIYQAYEFSQEFLNSMEEM